MIKDIDIYTPIRDAIKQLVENDKYLAGAEGSVAIRILNLVYFLLVNDLGYQPMIKQYVLGHTEEDYMNWKFYKERKGYDIWYYELPDLLDDDENNFLAQSNYVLNYKGRAGALNIQTFDSILSYKNETFTDLTSILSDEAQNFTDILTVDGEILYIGSDEQFDKIQLKTETNGLGYSIDLSYSSLDDAGTPNEVFKSITNFEDTTEQFTRNGYISFTKPNDWQKTTINGITKYWIAITQLTTPTTSTKADYLSKGTSVDALLLMYDEDVFNKNWYWCIFDNKVYVCIPNTGHSIYEGDLWISHTSEDDLKKQFFIYNNKYLAYIKQQGYKRNNYYKIITVWDNQTRPQDLDYPAIGFNQDLQQWEGWDPIAKEWRILG